MEIKKGISVSPGVVISTAFVLDAEDLLVPKRVVEPDQLPAEVARLQEAVAKSTDDLTRLRDDTAAKLGPDIARIFDFHLGVLRDKTVVKQSVEEVKKQGTTAEYAFSAVMRRYANTFLQMSDTYLRERVNDVYDIERRVLRNLIGQKFEDLTHL